MHNYFNAAYQLATMNRRLHWNRRKIAEYQAEQLRAIMKNAYDNVEYYHQKLKELTINPLDIRGSYDLNRFPILDRKEMIPNIRRMISQNAKSAHLRVLSTSGSTGQPMSTYINRSEDVHRKAKHLRANAVVGQRALDKWVVVTAPHHFAEATDLQRMLHIYSAIPLSVFDSPTKQLITLQKIKPHVLDGYSSSLLLIAQEMIKSPHENVKPRIVIGGAELIDHASRKIIEESFKAPFYDQYATVEFERLAWQCTEKAGYHMDLDSVIMQFVDKNGEEVAPGERGEIICTSLFNYTMPFIRYATGDIGRAPSENECPCGITFPLMQMVEGRKDSVLNFADGRTVTALALGWIMEDYVQYDKILQYRVIQKKKDCLKFLIKKKPGPPLEKTMETSLQKHITESLNFKTTEIAIEVEFVEEIAVEPSGKLRKVISETN